MSLYWFYYERTAQFVHACLVRGIWNFIEMGTLLNEAVELRKNSPNVMFETCKNYKSIDDLMTFDIIRICNIPVKDTFNLDRFKKLYDENQMHLRRSGLQIAIHDQVIPRTDT